MVIQFIFAMYLIADFTSADQSAVRCAPLLSSSSFLQSAPEEDWRAVYLSLLNLVLEGIDESDSHQDRTQVKVELLNKLASSSRPISPLDGLTNHFSPKLSTLAESGQIEIVTENLSDIDWTYLRQAVQEQLRLLQKIQNAQYLARPETQEDYIDILDGNKENRLFHLIRARRFTDVDSFLITSSASPQYLNRRNRNGETSLEVLISIDKNHPLIQVLEAKGARRGQELVFLEAELLDAVSTGDFKKVNLLYDWGVDIESDSNWSICPLFIAVRGNIPNATATIKTLLRLGASTENKDPSGPSVLFYALLFGAPLEVFEALIEGQVDLGVTYKGLNLFEFATSFGRLDLMRLFVSKGLSTRISNIAQTTGARIARNLIDLKVDLNAKTLPEGGTLLHAAVVRLNVSLIKDLLENGADPEITDDFGRTPLELDEQRNGGAPTLNIRDLLKKYIYQKHMSLRRRAP